MRHVDHADLFSTLVPRRHIVWLGIDNCILRERIRASRCDAAVTQSATSIGKAWRFRPHRGKDAGGGSAGKLSSPNLTQILCCAGRLFIVSSQLCLISQYKPHGSMHANPSRGRRRRVEGKVVAVDCGADSLSRTSNQAPCVASPCMSHITPVAIARIRY